ncbi:hypothetical protein GGX14DRAFT_579792 [Mycena pura]|uniref:DUF6532 domain-containing protein n=1 Tax=Mycena pura TaxID=153505 RepID=A0AAD6Y028_9AGAR|nr:hypothetical protein GGX14DRAFT_579792 [Mycena pura]
MSAADAAVRKTYGFKEIDEVTPEDGQTQEEAEEAVKIANRELVTQLEDNYTQREPTGEADAAAICTHPSMLSILKTTCFAKRGKNSRAHYFEDKDGIPLEILPLPTLALIMDAIACAISRWETGEHDVESKKFSADAYGGDHHVETMAWLKLWVAEFADPEVNAVNVAENVRRDLLRNARGSVKAPAKAPPAKKQRLSTAVFSRAAAGPSAQV